MSQRGETTAQPREMTQLAIQTQPQSPNSTSNTQLTTLTSEPQTQTTTAQLSPTRPAAWTRFSIKTKRQFLSSGFPCDDRLRDLGVTDDQWYQFSQAIVQSAKLTAKEDYAAWTTGLTTGAIGFPFVVGPWLGWQAGKAVHKKVVISKVKERLLEGGEMIAILRQWNNTTWERKGFHTWIEFPGDVGANGESSKDFRIAVIPNPHSNLRVAQFAVKPEIRPQTSPINLRNELTHSPQTPLPEYSTMMTPPGVGDSELSSVRPAAELSSSQQAPHELDGSDVPVKR